MNSFNIQFAPVEYANFLLRLMPLMTDLPEAGPRVDLARRLWHTGAAEADGLRYTLCIHSGSTVRDALRYAFDHGAYLRCVLIKDELIEAAALAVTSGLLSLTFDSRGPSYRLTPSGSATHLGLYPVFERYLVLTTPSVKTVIARSTRSIFVSSLPARSSAPRVFTPDQCRGFVLA